MPPRAAWPSALKPALGGNYKKSGNPHELTHPVRRQCGAGRPRSSWRWVAQGRDAQWRQIYHQTQLRRDGSGTAARHMRSLIQWGVFVPALSEPKARSCEGYKVGAIPFEEGMAQQNARKRLFLVRF